MKDAVKFQYATSESNPANLLTKPPAVPRHERLLQRIGLTPTAPITEDFNTMNDANLEKEKGVWFFGEKKGMRVIRNWKRKEGFFC